MNTNTEYNLNEQAHMEQTSKEMDEAAALVMEALWRDTWRRGASREEHMVMFLQRCRRIAERF